MNQTDIAHRNSTIDNIAITNGSIREMARKDIHALTQLSEDELVQSMYFVNPPTYLPGYWKSRLLHQMVEQEIRPPYIRRSYELPIEQDGTVKGILCMQISPSYHKEERHLVRMSYLIGREFRRNGVMEECLRSAIPFAFENLNAGKITVTCLSENTASLRLIEKIGFTREWEGISLEGETKGRNVIIYQQTCDDNC